MLNQHTEPAHTHTLQADSLSKELYKRSEVPADVVSLLKSLPTSLHPMSQLVIGLMALQKDSKFAAAYAGACPCFLSSLVSFCVSWLEGGGGCTAVR